MCTVKKASVPSLAHHIWTCSCFTFWEQTVCAHVYYRQYGGSPSISMKPAYKKTKVSMKHMSKRYKHKSGFEESDDDNLEDPPNPEKDSMQSEKGSFETFALLAPPGKLRIYINASGGEMPAITGISESSALVGRVKIGDRLTLVDGVECTGLSNQEVCNLIARGVNQPSRRMVFVRQVGL